MRNKLVEANLNLKLSSTKKEEKERIKAIARKLSNEHPREIIRWGLKELGVKSITFACSFGYEDVALLDMIHKIDPSIDVFYLDTDLLFPETYELRNQLSQRYQREFTQISPYLSLDEQSVLHGEELWKVNANKCCFYRKVEPLKRYLVSFKGWITGLRREQSLTRAQAEVVEWDDTFNLVKLNPLTLWNTKQVWQYIHNHQLPYNPLHDKQYPSIGCKPCTRPVQKGKDPRSGRWPGVDKIECGLHL